MKSFKLLTLATFALLGSAAQAGTNYPSAITFDGYCDGLSNIQGIGNGVVIGEWDLSNCGNHNHTFVGLHDCLEDQKGVTGHYNDNEAGKLLVRVNQDGTWFYLDPQGNVYNQGTWTNASEGGVRGTRISARP